MERRIRKVMSPVPKPSKRARVAAYARVSSGKDAMLHSLSAQVSYYSSLIQNNPRWEYSGVFADEAQTGTKDERPEFRRLLADCEAGNIDMVITKSVSRFARNTVTLLETVRKLKALKIDVFFEKENIHSMSGDGELMLTILASFAQEESKSVSDNCKWRIRERFKNGEMVSLRYMYGYDITREDIAINEPEAVAVRSIFRDYIAGVSVSDIARRLQEAEVPRAFSEEWTQKRVRDILGNEKYAGNALLQKKYVKDHLGKKLAWNHGELPMYFAKCTHPAIVSEETYRLAQTRRAQNREKTNTKGDISARYPFSSMIVCANCGKSYRRITSRGRAAWNCDTYVRNGAAACPAKKIPEETLEAVTAEVLGIPVLDAGTFRNRIDSIVVPVPNRLIFRFRDGRELTQEWADRSRSESWDDAARQRAKERTTEWRKRK